MARKAANRAQIKKVTKRAAAKKPKRTPAKKSHAEKPNKAITASAGKSKEKSFLAVAATHLEHMAYGLGYHIPSAWWRRAS
jgi:hypothetical protein